MRTYALLTARPALCAVALMLIVFGWAALVPDSASDSAGMALAQDDPLTDPADLSVDVKVVVGGLQRLVGVTNAGDGSDWLFILEKAGRVRIVADGELLDEPFLDIVRQVESRANERGLLGIAFHPNYAENGYFYLNYTTSSGGLTPGIGTGDTVVSRFEVSADDPYTADPDSESLVIAYDQPYGNHNGGHVAFGPDGYLYIGTGDGGSGGDPENRAQNGREMLGKMLRIDVDVDDGVDRPYVIPPDNPFVDETRFHDEIWAYGLRNPWRYAFDSLTGDLYIGDVGQSALEEIDFQPADSAGGENYGWRIMEGTNCHNPRSGCSKTGLVLPVAEYGRGEGKSVTGGEVYRGQMFSRFKGTYFYADYVDGNVWGMNRDAAGEWRDAIIGRFSFNPSSFGQAEDGEIYVVSDRGGASALYHMIDPDTGSAPTTEVPTVAPTETDEPTEPPPPPTATPSVPPPTPTETPSPAYMPWARTNR